jgi:hypothetical protein
MARVELGPTISVLERAKIFPALEHMTNVPTTFMHFYVYLDI